MKKTDLDKLYQLISIACQQELLPRFRKCRAEFKADGSFLTDADLAMQRRLQQDLKKHWPMYDFFAEEMSPNEMDSFFKQYSEGFWCLDPLDGTSNFAAGLPYFSVSLALIKKGQIELGVVYDPNRDECFSALKGQGAWLNKQTLNVARQHLPLEKSIALIDLKRLPPELRQRLVLDPPYHSQRSLGSVALDWCWLAAERVQVYLHGKQMLWDYAAGLLVAQESGCFSLALDGQPVYQLGLQARQAMGAVDKLLFSEWKKYLENASKPSAI